MPIFLLGWIVLGGIYTVEQNERAVLTSFGRAIRLPGQTCLEMKNDCSITHQDIYARRNEENIATKLQG